ncbi:MAG: sensor histidine kinase [Actinomycetota bacterium]
MTDSLEIFPWNENFECGIAEIDDQHKVLVRLLNVLVGHLAYQFEAPAVDAIFAELKAYTELHFATEEKIWGQHFGGDPWESWHKEAHADFVGKLIEMKEADNGRSYDERIEEIVAFLTHWLALHIIESDKRMAKVVLALPSGVSLERAKDLANKEMSGATRVLIDTVMSMYDNLARRTILLTREINARVRSEDALKAVHAELVRLKDEAVVAEQRSRRDLENFAYVLAHHLQEPVRQQMIHTSKLRRAIGDCADESAEILYATDQVVQGADRLRSLLRDVERHLSLSRSPWSATETDTAKVLDTALRRLAAKVRATGATVERAPMPAVPVDPVRLADVFTALVDNALSFTRDGVAPVVSVGAILSDGIATFHVEDNGVGIPPAYREKAFDIFEHFHPRSRDGGTGIGLAVVRKIVESAGGRVWIAAHEGGGTRVEFTIPADIREPAEA